MNMRIGAISALVFTTFFLYPVIRHIDKPLATRDDVAYAYFLMDNNLSKLAAGDVGHLFNTRMFYPLRNTLALGNSMLGQSIMGIPMYLITRNTVTTTNIVMVLHFVLSYLFLYVLAYRLTKSMGGSVIAGIIYAFNPYMMSRLHPELIVFEWIPLSFLVAENLLARVSWGWIVIGAITILLLLFSSFYYFFFVMLLLPVYIGIRMLMTQISPYHFFRPAIIVGILFTVSMSYVYLRPYVAQKHAYNVYREIEDISAYSARLPDFLFTTAENLTYGKLGRGSIARAMWSSTALLDAFEHPYEHRLFPGIVATLFFFSAVWFIVSKKFSASDRRFIIPYAVILGLSLILMFGPAAMVYRIIYALPFADTLRAPTRFMVTALFALAIMTAYIWKKINKRVLLLLVLVILCFEYRYNFGSFTDIPADVKAFYRQLDHIQDIRTVIEVPMTNGAIGSPFTARSDIEDAYYLYNALYHHKNLVNGYSGYIPPVYQKVGRMVDSEFPSEVKLSELKKMGVDAVIIHLDEYAYPSYGEVTVRGFNAMGIREIVSTDTIRAYRIH